VKDRNDEKAFGKGGDNEKVSWSDI